MAHVERLRIYPIKGLDAIELAESYITDAGTMAGDRAYALTVQGADGTPESINGKQSERFHELSTDFDPETQLLSVRTPDGTREQFDLERDLDSAGEWLCSFLDVEATLRRREPPAFVDRPAAGPSVISTATLEEVAGWFDGMSVEGARRRLRANVEVGGVPAFWEDQFVGEAAPGFETGGVRLEGVEPCARCVVPSRDPDTGDPLPEFRERFLERREATFPEWADREAFDHLYTLMLIARVPGPSRGTTIAVGDTVDADTELPGRTP